MTFSLAGVPRRARILAGVAFGFAVLYAVLGFLVAPRLVRAQLAKQLAAALHRPAAVGPVRVNPFALSVTVDSVRVADRDGQMLLSWDRFYINFELLSIVRREMDFAEVSLIHPYLRIVVRKDGSLNVTDIADSLAAAPSSGPAPVVAIEGLHIDAARVDVIDSATPRPFATTIGPWKIDLAAFATRRDNNSRYSFSGRTESGESFAWAGTVAIDPVRSSGEFSLDSIRLAKYGNFYEQTVGFDVLRGFGGVKAGYVVDLTPKARRMKLTAGDLRLSDLVMVERGHRDTAYAVPSLRVSGVEIDGGTRRATIGSVAAHGVTVRAERSRDSTINLLRLIEAREEKTAARASVAAAAAPAAPARPPWRWLVARISLDSSNVTFIDSATVRPAAIALANVAVSLDSVASEPDAQTRVKASAAWGKTGALTADGAVRIWRRSGEFAITARDISLRPFDAYPAPAINLLISEGRLTADAKLRFDMADTLHPDLGFKGNVRVDRFATVDGRHRDPFFSFASLRFANIDYAQRAQRLSVKEIALIDPVLNTGVAEDGTPVTRIIFPNPAADSADADSSRADSAAPPAPAAPAPKKDTAHAAPQMKASIGSIRIVNGALHVNDKSLQPAVAFSITKLNAQTGRLSSDSLGTGTLTLTASIDDVAPVKVTGSFNPLSAKEGSDLTVDLQGMELIPVSPYSGKFLGYMIAKGKLKVEMQYRVVGRQLKSENKLILDGFTFGDKTESPVATKMPVKLGFSIMRDRNGQIVFDVPIEGNLDDPNFRLGRVIGRAILNVLTKLITSPFKLLGGMFGGGNADLSYVEFAPGAAALQPAETKKLDVLAKSLFERPELKLEIAGAADSAADRAALRTAKLDAQLRTRKWTALKAKDKDTPPPDSLTLTPADRPLWLAAAFAAAFPQDSAVLAAKKAKSSAPPYPAPEMERRLTAAIAISADDLRLLAADRARKCQDYLLTAPANKIDAERVFLTEGAMKFDGARAVFTLQ